MQRIGCLLLVVLLAAPALAHVDPHQRSPSLETPSQEPITALTIGPGSIIAGTEDPDGGITQPPAQSRLDVWYRWTEQGSLDAADDADPSDTCTSTATNDCRYHVVAMDLSEDGLRLGIISARENGQGGVLILTDISQGLLNRIDLGTNTPTVIDVSGDGTRVSLGMAVNGVGAPTGQVTHYEWTTPPTLKWSRATASPVTAVSVSDNGLWTMATGGGLYRYDSTGAAASATPADVPKPMATDDTAGYTTYGTDSGKVALVTGGTVSAPSIRDLNPAAKRPITSAAIAPGGEMYVAGDDRGVIGLFANPAKLNVPDVRLERTVSSGPAVNDLVWSQDGSYIVAGVGTQVRLYEPTVDGLGLVWSVEAPTTVTAVATSKDGGLIAAAAGTKILLFDASYELVVDAPGGEAVPGEPFTTEIAYTNNGNRPLHLNLDVVGIQDWAFDLDADTVDLLPGESTTISLDITAPTQQPPGTTTLQLRHSGTTAGTTEIPIVVPQVHRWVLSPNGSLHAAIEPGDSRVYSVFVTNAGNGQDTTLMDVAVTAGWAVDWTPSSVDLAPQGTAEVLITLTAPADAQELDAGEMTVSAVGDPLASLLLSGTVGAQFGGAITVSGTTPVDAGNATKATVTIRNAGNAIDSFLVTPGALPVGWSILFPDGAVEHSVPGLPAGATSTFDIDVHVPAGAKPGVYDLKVVSTSSGDDGNSVEGTVRVFVKEPPAETGGGKEKSPLGAWVLLAGLAIALGRRRT